MGFIRVMFGFVIGLAITYGVYLYIDLGKYNAPVQQRVQYEYVAPIIRTVNRGGNTCGPGRCWSNGSCCPSSARYYCQGSCYRTAADARNAGRGRCLDFRVAC